MVRGLKALWTLCAVTAAGAGYANAQTQVRTHNGGVANDLFGSAVSPAGDVNNDGIPDYLVGAAEDGAVFQEREGYARVFSGADGSQIRQHDGENVTERYGTALTEGLLMASRDGVQFKRWNEAFLRPGIGRTGSWQYGQHYIAWNIVETASELPGAPNELSLYATEDHWHGQGGKLRRYTLRLDGFVSIHASMKGGEFLSRPLRFTGSKLTINHSTSAAGSVRVEMQDEDGEPIKGFSLAECPEQFGDSLDHTVTWTDNSDVSSLSGKVVRLRFVLKDADLYSLRFAN